MLRFTTELQRQLVSAVLDDFSPNAALPGTYGGQYGDTPERWRDAVIEFVCTMLKAGLVAPLPGIEGYEVRTPSEIRDLLCNGDQANGFDAELLWDVIHFTGTEKLRNLLRSMGLANWEAMSGGLSSDLKSALVQMGILQS